MSESSKRVESAIEELLDDWGEDPRAINNGECMEFINQLFLQNEFSTIPLVRMETDDLPDEYVDHETGFKTEPYHMWVTDGSLHFDAEVPAGVDTWKKLPFFKRTLGF
jgi:hypothetical protein